MIDIKLRVDKLLSLGFKWDGKDYNKDDIISYPQINNDVFIVRQDLSAFELNYKLEFIKKLIDLETYAGGKFFNVVNNT